VYRFSAARLKARCFFHINIKLDSSLPFSELLWDEQDMQPSSHAAELVLLVEDEPNVRRVVRQQLIDLGYPVLEADNPTQALALVAQVPDIAIMLSDIILSDAIDGRQLSQQIIASQPQMRVLLMSGYSEGAIDASGPPLLAKPFVKQDLARALLATIRGQA
jgi:CheY-like chemotaxis protein